MYWEVVGNSIHMGHKITDFVFGLLFPLILLLQVLNVLGGNYKLYTGSLCGLSDLSSGPPFVKFGP